ncbi:universal stress protein [Corynebacterium sp. 335C]
MTTTILVGYTATATGRDALNLGIALARHTDCELRIAMVAPQDDYYGISAHGIGLPYDATFPAILHRQMTEWLDESLAEIPDDVPATAGIVGAPTDHEGLLLAAEKTGASCIVIGSRGGGLLRSVALGSVARELLRTSTKPVVLAPAGYRRHGRIGRYTAMAGRREGAADVLRIALDHGRTGTRPLRFATLEMPDSPKEPDGILGVARRVGDDRLIADVEAALADGSAVEVVARGRTIEDAARSLEWGEGGMVILGSARVAPRGRLSLGRVAARMLKQLPVPVLVVPAGAGDSRREDAADD